MSILTIAIIVFCAWIVVMLVVWCARLGNALSIVFVLGVVAIAVGVSWQRIEQYHAQRAPIAAFHQRSPVAAVAVSPPVHAPSGT